MEFCPRKNKAVLVAFIRSPSPGKHSTFHYTGKIRVDIHRIKQTIKRKKKLGIEITECGST